MLLLEMNLVHLSKNRKKKQGKKQKRGKTYPYTFTSFKKMFISNGGRLVGSLAGHFYPSHQDFLHIPFIRV